MAGEFAWRGINGDLLVPLYQALGLSGACTLPTINGGQMRPYSGSIALLYPGDGLNGANREALQALTRFAAWRCSCGCMALAGCCPPTARPLPAGGQPQLRPGPAEHHGGPPGPAGAASADATRAGTLPPGLKPSKGFTLLMRGRG